MLSSFSLQADENTDELPSIAFLEYLAEMKEVDGQLYGPLDMDLKLCQTTAQKREEQKNESSSDHDEAQNSKALKRLESAKDKECKYHDKTDTTDLD